MIGHQNFQNGGYNQGFAFNNPLYNPQYSPPQQSQTQAQQPTIQYSSIVIVRNEQEARNYPVGLGTSVPFKNENEPYMYTKTMGFNQLEQPVFKKYKLIEEIEAEEIAPAHNAEIDELRAQINDLRELIKSSISKSSGNKRNSKEEVVND